MDLSTLKTHIKTKTFDPFYIFTGPEVGVMDIYIRQIAKVQDADVVMLDGIEDLAKDLCISIPQTHRVVKKIFGVGFKKILTKKRIYINA